MLGAAGRRLPLLCEEGVKTECLEELSAVLGREERPGSDLPGTTIKSEARTTIVLLPGDSTKREDPPASIVLKVYRYPAWSRWRTWRQASKARREFEGLAFCRRLGIPAVAPIACGSERSPAGLVRSCHLATAYEPGTMPLRRWLEEGRFGRDGGRQRLETWLAEIGEALRTLHARRFFLLTASSKNVLVRDAGAARDSWLFVDMPYARFLRGRPVASLGQKRDVGALTGSVARYAGEEVLEAFYAGYLPDPLGRSEAALRTRARRGADRHNRQTLLRRARDRIRRALRPRKRG
jgi:hypothetical protein